MQRRMLDAVSAIPGVTAAGYITRPPLNVGAGDSAVYTDTTTDFRPTNTVADAMNYNISPGYFQAAGTHLLAGRDLAFSDDKNAPTVALVNRTFAIKVFGSIQNAVGGHFKFWDGKRAQVVGVVEDGKYRTLTEDQMPAMFFSFLQHTQNDATFVVRSTRDPQDLAPVLQRTLSALDPSLPVDIAPLEHGIGLGALSRPRRQHRSRHPRLARRHARRHRHLRHGLLRRLQAHARARHPHGPRRRPQADPLRLARPRLPPARHRFRRRHRPRRPGHRVLAFIVYQATPKDPLVLGGVTLTMLLLGMMAAFLPARRALAVDPLDTPARRVGAARPL